MTDSMNFGPDWIRNLSSEGSTGITGGGAGGGTRYQLAEYRYGREEMLALFDKNAKPPVSVSNFKCLYSEQCLSPLALLPSTEEEMLSQQQPPVIRGWQGRPAAGGGGLGGVPNPGRGGGRGGSMERGGRPSRGRGYQYGGGGRGAYDGSWGGPGAAGGSGVQGDPAGDQWSPRKEYSGGRGGMENWRRSRPMSDEHLSGEPGGEGAGWRRMPVPTSSMYEKWGRSTSWRDSTGAGVGDDDRPPATAERQRGGSSWNSGGDGGRPPMRRPGGNSGSWDHEDHLPEWATENPADGGGSFDEKGAFHGSDDEQLDGRVSNRREPGLQKSTSQQHISTKTHPPPLSSSKSSMSLVNNPEDSTRKKEFQKSREEDQNLTKENNAKSERKKSVPSIPEKVDKEILVQERAKSEGPQRSTISSEKSHQVVANGPLPEISRTSEEPDFEKLQEDFVLKLVVDEEPPRQQQHQRQPPGGFEPPSGAGVTSSTVPPNLAPPPTMHHQQPSPQQNVKWFYQDPQGQTQGPFTDVEMAEWYKAGYFSNQLKVRRHHDDRYFLLGELIALCGGASNPFSMAALRFPPLKVDATGAVSAGGPTSPAVVGGKDAAVAAAAAADLLQLQYLSQMAAYKQAQARAAMAAEPWGAAAALQHEMAAAQQRLMMHQQVPQDLQYMQQPPTANPLMHMINQMQQANKLPGQGLVDTKPPNMPGALDPHLQLHVGNLLSMQNRIPPAGLASGLPTGLAPTLTGGLPPETIPGLQSAAAAVSLGPNGLPLTGIATTAGAAAVPRPPDQIPGAQGTPQQDQDPISSLLKQLQQQKQQSQQIDSLWQQNQYGIPPTTAPPAGQWSAPNDVPLSMWDIQQSAPPISQPPSAALAAVSQQQNQTPASQNVPQVPVTEPEKDQTVHTPKKEKDKDSKKEDKELKEVKKKKEQEEKQAKKDAEERKKQELKKQEVEKKAAEEKKRKEEERVKKELEKVKREAEDKRQRELEEKRRLKEQRKAEEENRKKLEEQRKAEEQQRAEEERLKVERELDTKKEQQARVAKTAPWSQSNSNAGMSLAEIQKAEREKRAQDAVIQMQRLQEQEIMQQKEQEKIVSGIQLNWANKPMEPRKVKSLAEIQAEEQEMLAKQLAESRLQKEKEPPQVVTNTSSSIWNGQNLTWATASAQNAQWSATSVAVAGFWEESNSGKPAAAVKPSTVSKSNSTNNFQQQQQAAKQKQQQQQAKAKAKKEEAAKANHNNNNGPTTDDFTTWCYKTLSNISTNVDIPTFVSFLRDIESAFDVREYCKEYLGESGATHQFASSFLERRRQCRPQRRDQHKDDMCVPAPAITPQGGHMGGMGEFQEVKGKNKKNKKSKMLKVDSRILGFNVTSAPDRINVGDRDYGDNS